MKALERAAGKELRQKVLREILKDVLIEVVKELYKGDWEVMKADGKRVWQGDGNLRKPLRRLGIQPSMNPRSY